jgi:hypothetical protein
VAAAPSAKPAKPAISLKISDATLEAGQAFSATGRLTKPTKRPVVVQMRTGSAWKQIAKGRSTRRGKYSMRALAPTSAGRFLLRTVAPTSRVKGTRLPAVRSKHLTIAVTARTVAPSSVTARAARTSYVVGETVEITGNVTPAVARPIDLQRLERDGSWRTVGSASSTPQGAGAITHLLEAGSWSYRLAAPASADLAGAVSAPVAVDVSLPAPPATRLQIVVTGLPSTTAADVALVGPDGVTQVVSGDRVLDVSAGEWAVTPRPVRVATDTYNGVESTHVVHVDRGRTTSLVVDYGVIVPETTTVAPPGEIKSVTNLGDGTLRVELTTGGTLAGPATVAAHHRRATDRLIAKGVEPAVAQSESTCRAMENGVLCEGNIFVAGTSARTPDGLFARVPEGGLIDSNTLLVTTHGATLTEAVKLGRTPTADLGKKLEVTNKELDTKYFDCTGSLKAALDASARVEPSLDFTMDVTWGRLTKAEAVVKVEQTAELTATLVGQGECEVDPQKLIDRPLPPVTVHLGPIPVVLSPRLHVTLRAEGKASGSSKLGWTEKASSRFGLSYDGSGFKAVKELNPPKITEVPAQFQGEASARASLTAGVDVLLYGVAGPRIAAEAALLANAKAYGTASGASVVWSAGYDVSAYAQFVTNERLETGPLGIESERLDIWGPHRGTLLNGMVAWQPPPGYFPQITTTSLPGAMVGVAYDQRIETADNREGWWQLDSGQLPDGLTLDRDTGRVTGIPGRLETSAFAVRFTDGQGHSTLSGNITIEVAEARAVALPDAYAGHPATPDYYERLPAAAGETGEWTIESGSLPPGLALTSSGWLTGRPTTMTRYGFVARLDRPDGSVLRQEYQLSVIEVWLDSGCTYNNATTTMIVAGLDLSGAALHSHRVVVRLNGVTELDMMSTPGRQTGTGRFWDSLPRGVAYHVELVIDGHVYEEDVYCST